MKQSSTTRQLSVLNSSSFLSINPPTFFRKYGLILLLTCITLSICSCKKEDGRCIKAVPFEAVFQVTSEITQAGPPTLISATGTGVGTHIGKSTFLGHAQIDANNIFTDNGIITTANGDQIFGTTKEGASPVIDPTNGNVLIISNNIITGGTGKYEGATGSYTTIAHASLVSPDGIDSLKGTIIIDKCGGNK